MRKIFPITVVVHGKNPQVWSQVDDSAVSRLRVRQDHPESRLWTPSEIRFRSDDDDNGRWPKVVGPQRIRKKRMTEKVRQLDIAAAVVVVVVAVVVVEILLLHQRFSFLRGCVNQLYIYIYKERQIRLRSCVSKTMRVEENRV